MALITCPECGKDVSTLATGCPSCGAPIHALMQEGNAVTHAHACPMCGKTLQPRATLCMDCNVNVKTGKRLEPPSFVQAKRSSVTSVRVFVLLVLLVAIGYWQRRGISDLLIEQGIVPIREDNVENPPQEPGFSDEKPAAPASVREGANYTSARQPAALPQPNSSVQSVAGQPTRVSARPVSPASEASPSKQQEQRINLSCPLCRSEGRLPEPGSQRWTYQCPLCFGKGGRELVVETGQAVCRSCGGMGRIARMDNFKREKNRYLADPCSACRGSGLR